MEKIFFKTNIQKVLRFLIQNPTKEFIASEIQKKINISRAGINFALQELLRNSLVKRKARGKAYVYQVRTELSIIKQLKVLNTVVRLYPLIDMLAEATDKVILFGSCARGEDTDDSDIDLLAVTHDKVETRKILEKFKELKIKTIIKTASELDKLSKENPDFYAEIDRGIILSIKNNEYQI